MFSTVKYLKQLSYHLNIKLALQTVSAGQSRNCGSMPMNSANMLALADNPRHLPHSSDASQSLLTPSELC